MATRRIASAAAATSRPSGTATWRSIALQAASRVLLVDQVEPERVTEAFGLYALSGKATTFVGPLLIAVATGMFDSQRLGVTPIILLLIAGMVLLPFVRSAHSRT